MNIFISWSGNLSKEIAEIIKNWIPGVIQAVQPYYSPDDISKGTRWSSEISKKLDISKIGIICLTKENLESPWIMFEAGALSKNLEKSKVCPILFGVEPSDMKGPLVQFQAAKFSKSEIRKVMKMINEELEDGKLEQDVFNNVFNMWWSKLDEQVKKAIEKSKKKTNVNLRSDRDILEEVLSLSRNLTINRKQLSTDDFIHPDAINDLINTIEELYNFAVHNDGNNDEIFYVMNGFSRPIKYILSEARKFYGVRRTQEISKRWENLITDINSFN